MDMAIAWDWLKQKNFRLNDPNLHPVVAQCGWEVVFEAWQRGIYVLITQGYRSIAEQNELYAQGRTKPGKIVTNAKGGTSYHNYGLALDFALYTPDGKQVVWDMNTDFNKNHKKDWMEVVQMFKARGFEWGGDWRSFKDYPHVQMTFGFSIAQLKAGKRPSRPAMVVQVPELTKVVASVTDKKEEEYMIPVSKADKIIALIQAEWKEKDEQIKQYQKMWQEENAKPDKCQQKLDEYHRAAEALRKDKKELGELADEVRKVSGRRAANN
ncbi:M15 family metallopeptidase (plasmid) [Aneurinibacillus thermoaerophilus]|uniref:M15 family metallopeptidase n=2 Tax=Aneurinibacillus thermoaerophilus TaxID=143495 RepID=A0ABX8YH11_ANETH|nr:M15 family metallopeptidase [Aneurinibacillus thermoaerophilus]